MAEPRRRYSRPDLEYSDEPVMAWRFWWLKVGGVLCGVNEDWESSLKVASCRRGHEAPDWDCWCGVYALAVADEPGSSPRVWGRVELSGSVVVHENGYRASHVRITDLWAGDDADLFLELTMRYPDVTVWMGEPNDEEGTNG